MSNVRGITLRWFDKQTVRRANVPPAAARAVRLVGVALRPVPSATSSVEIGITHPEVDRLAALLVNLVGSP